MDNEYTAGYKKRKNMRGRKGKYYSQVDDEDQNFLEQERRLQTGGAEDEDDEDRLGMIEEESQHSTQRKHSEEDSKLLKTSPRGPPTKGKSPKGPSPTGSANATPR